MEIFLQWILGIAASIIVFLIGFFVKRYFDRADKREAKEEERSKEFNDKLTTLNDSILSIGAKQTEQLNMVTAGARKLEEHAKDIHEIKTDVKILKLKNGIK